MEGTERNRGMAGNGTEWKKNKQNCNRIENMEQREKELNRNKTKQKKTALSERGGGGGGGNM